MVTLDKAHDEYRLLALRLIEEGRVIRVAHRAVNGEEWDEIMVISKKEKQP